VFNYPVDKEGRANLYSDWKPML